MKYYNKKTVVDGFSFDSQKEAKRWHELNILHKAGIISDLQRQVKFDLVVNGIAICKYIADFTYTDIERGSQKITEDVKSDFTKKIPVYRLKKKLMLAVHGINILET